MTVELPDHGRTVTAPMEHCWRRIGVGGDRSCPELSTFIHCRNCPVVAAAARRFFDRPAPAGYLESWADVLAQPVAATDANAQGVLIFRLGDEWLALPTAALVEVASHRQAHRVPHRARTELAGIVNIRGQLQLCVRLASLLGLEPATGDEPAAATTARLLVVEHREKRGADRWVFAVDEVAGMHRLAREELTTAPSTVGNASWQATAGLFNWRGKRVALLDETRLLNGLHRLVSA